VARSTKKPLRRRDFLRRAKHVLPQVFPDRAERLLLEVHMLTGGMQVERNCSLCSMRTWAGEDRSAACGDCIRWCAARVQEHENDTVVPTDALVADIVRGLRAAGGDQAERLIAYLEAQAAHLSHIQRGQCLFCGLDSERRSASKWGAKIPMGPLCGDCVRRIATMDPETRTWRLP